MHLKEALGVRRGEMVSLIGAGGKTTTLFRLAKELRDEGGKVLVTTTTKIFKPTKPHVDRLFLVEDVVAFPAEISKLKAPVIIGAGYRIDEDDKLVGLPAASRYIASCARWNPPTPIWTIPALRLDRS